MRLGVEAEAAQFHAHGRRHGSHLDLIGACLPAERRQDPLRDAPAGDGILRRITHLLVGQVLGGPIACLQVLGEFDAEIICGCRSQAGGPGAEGQPASLLRAVNLGGFDAVHGQEAQVEAGIVGDYAESLRRCRIAGPVRNRSITATRLPPP